MADTLIQRIAQTIYFADHPGAPESVALTEREVTMARDILAAIREPTAYVLDVGLRVDSDSPLERKWRAMIDAALSEE